MASKEESKDKGAGQNPPLSVEDHGPIDPDDGYETPEEIELKELAASGDDVFYAKAGVAGKLVVRSAVKTNQRDASGNPIVEPAIILNSSIVNSDDAGNLLNLNKRQLLRRIRISDQDSIRRRMVTPKELVKLIKQSNAYRTGLILRHQQFVDFCEKRRKAEGLRAEADALLAAPISKRGRVINIQ